jgi:hypothetical protein
MDVYLGNARMLEQSKHRNLSVYACVSTLLNLHLSPEVPVFSSLVAILLKAFSAS